MSDLEPQLYQDLLEGYEAPMRLVGYNATRARLLLDQHPPVEAARRLLEGEDWTTGLTRLWEHRLLRYSAEYIVLYPRYEALFTESERSTARRRLADLGQEPPNE
jgi:hypothetical protein